MRFEQHKQERQALVQHLLAQEWDVFGTLKFVNGRTIGRQTAHLLLRSYWNNIDRVFFGKAAERQDMRIPRWCFAHEGSDSENFHVHFVLRPLCWAGVLLEHWDQGSKRSEAVYLKTPLWAAWLQLDTDNIVQPAQRH